MGGDALGVLVGVGHVAELDDDFTVLAGARGLGGAGGKCRRHCQAQRDRRDR
jgi:hypothetical protein